MRVWLGLACCVVAVAAPAAVVPVIPGDSRRGAKLFEGGAVHQVPRGQWARRQGGARSVARGASQLHARAFHLGDVESRSHHVGRDGGGQDPDAQAHAAGRRRPVRLLLLRALLRQARRGGERQGDVRDQAVRHVSRHHRVARRGSDTGGEMGISGRSDSAGAADVESQFPHAPGLRAPRDEVAGVDRRRVERHPGVPSFAAGNRAPGDAIFQHQRRGRRDNSSNRRAASIAITANWRWRTA